jgi:hypothetical protein
LRTTRIILFLMVGAVIAATIGLAIESNVTRGPALSFRLVPEQYATSAQLSSDAAALVRRLQNLGYKDTSAAVNTGSIDLTMYGSSPQLRAGLQGALPAAILYVRPVQCAAPPFVAAGSAGQQANSAPSGASLRCSERYLLTARALHVDTSTGQPAVVAPDPTLASVPSTSEAEDVATRTVLIATGPESGFVSERLVAGPAGVVNADVVSAQASFQNPEWLIEVDLTSAGEKKYNELAKSQFHAYVAVDIDGTAISAPIMEPTLSSFGSLGAKLEIEAGFTKTQALALADDLASPLVVPLKLAS